jgi:hypothetical protein
MQDIKRDLLVEVLKENAVKLRIQWYGHYMIRATREFLWEHEKCQWSLGKKRGDVSYTKYIIERVIQVWEEHFWENRGVDKACHKMTQPSRNVSGRWILQTKRHKHWQCEEHWFLYTDLCQTKFLIVGNICQSMCSLCHTLMCLILYTPFLNTVPLSCTDWVIYNSEFPHHVTEWWYEFKLNSITSYLQTAHNFAVTYDDNASDIILQQ